MGFKYWTPREEGGEEGGNKGGKERGQERGREERREEEKKGGWKRRRIREEREREGGRWKKERIKEKQVRAQAVDVNQHSPLFVESILHQRREFKKVRLQRGTRHSHRAKKEREHPLLSLPVCSPLYLSLPLTSSLQ